MATNDRINILLTGGGAPGAAGILKCLGHYPSFHITVADASENAVGHYLSNDFIQIPFAHDPGFIDAMLNICRSRKIQAVLPLVTKELLPLSLYRSEFEKAGTKILVSDAESIEIANNKSRLYQFLEWRGIAVPAFRVVENIEQFKTALEELGYPSQTVCFKPSLSNGSRGFRIISDSVKESDLLFNYKPNASYISHADAIRILSDEKFPELLVSEYLPGEEYSVDCIASYGESSLIIPRLRKKMINGISVEGEFIKEDAIISYCAEIIRQLRLHGNIGLQVKKSLNGAFLLLEINPRVQGSISTALGAGVNLPVLAIKKQLGIAIDEEELTVRWGTRFSRYWEEVFY